MGCTVGRILREFHHGLPGSTPFAAAVCGSVRERLVLQMPYTLLADLLVGVHLAFVGFVICGGLLVGRWPWVVWLHVPAVVWGVAIEWMGWICPLTPLENWLRSQAGEAAYESDFVAQYLLPVLYPAVLTRATLFVLGSAVLMINALIYGRLWSRRRADRRIA